MLSLHDVIMAGCGTDSRPLPIEAQPGQTLNVTTLQSTVGLTNRPHSQCSDPYGQIVDVASHRTVHVCATSDGGDGSGMQSRGNKIEVLVNTAQSVHAAVLQITGNNQ